MSRPLPPEIEPFPGAQEQVSGHVCRCAWKGCAALGQFRAPKDRSLREHYLFCLEHVRAYNAQWDFHQGMSPSQMEQELRSSATWGRPTWKLGSLGSLGARLRPGQKPGWSFRVRDPLDLGADTEFDPRRKREHTERIRAADGSAEEARALKVLDLAPPLTLDVLTRRYKAMAKKHHPDANGGAPEAETRMKLINAAYRTLKAVLAAAF
jgi:hypothetical protein